MRTTATHVLSKARGLLLVVTLLPAMVAECQAGRLVAYTFDDVIIVWKSERAMEVAVGLIVGGELKDGDLDPLLECWVDSGAGAERLEILSGGLNFKVRVDEDDCEGIVFAEEYRD